jgi:hypothetical protein
MSRMNSSTPVRHYRATYIPKDVSADDAELKASQGVLPFVQFKAPNSGKAAKIAHAVTGLHVLSVERIEVPA